MGKGTGTNRPKTYTQPQPRNHTTKTNKNHTPPPITPTSPQVNKSYGGHSDRETPGPIPNPEAKPASADDTTQPGGKSRTPPNKTQALCPPILLGGKGISTSRSVHIGACHVS